MFNNSEKITLRVENMHCAHCAARVESAAKSVKGVKKASVDLDSASLEVTVARGTDPVAVIEAVSAAGYSASK